MSEVNSNHLLDPDPVSWKDLLQDEQFSSSANHDFARPGILDVKSWEQLSVSSELFPQYKNRARTIIKTRLGYLPSPSIILAYDSFLRSAAHALDHGHLKIEEYDKIADELVMQIRNKDMLWFDELEICESDYARYEQQKDSFSSLFVRDRITNLLGETLDKEITIPAELLLQFMVDDRIVFGDKPNEYDIRALTIIGYRKELLENGKAAANQSPLWYYEFAQSNGYFEEESEYARIPNVVRLQ